MPRKLANDNAHCEGTGCPLRDTCLRYVSYQALATQPPAELDRLVTFVSAPYDKGTNSCTEYWHCPLPRM